MSLVTNVMLSISIREEHTSYPGPPKGLLKNFKANFTLLTEIDKWLEAQGHGSFGEEIDAGGEKGFEACVFAAAFNYLDKQRFLDYLNSLHWKNRGAVQVFIKEQQEDTFTLYVLAKPTDDHEHPS